VGARDAGLVYACITHVPLWLEPPPWVTTIHLGEAQGEGRLNLRDLAPEWLPHHPVLGGTAGTFALRRHVLAHRPDATRVGVCQYRKFVSRDRISGVRDPRYRVMDVVAKSMLEGQRYGDALWPGDARFLVSKPRRFTRVFWHRRGYLREYARDHCVEDLLRFAAEAVEQGVLGAREVERFFREDVIVPGGVELGVYPAEFWLDAAGQIERVVRACVTKHATVRDGYQARVWSFCAERLGSWLLLKRFRTEVSGRPEGRIEWLDRRRWSARFSGQLNLVTDEAGHAGYSAGR
jgi:hypothetical protein